mmetsp:Transcript_3801/g.9096  ORF Transcript_3801/g.9096 Transcript_3801/m.9096 type:complete len:628 (+) Transcript_3801:666-2549(+)
MYTVELYFDLPSTAWFARCVTILNNSTFFRLQGSSLEELRKLFELLLPAPVCENAKTLLTLVQRLGGALSEQRELKQIAMESVAEVVCAMRNAAQREEDWLRILEEIDNDLAFQQKHVKKLNMEGAKATLQERLGCSSDLVKLASRKLEMLVGASGAMGLEAYIPQQHRDQAQIFINAAKDNFLIAQREVDFLKVTERERENMITVAHAECDDLTAQSVQLDGLFSSLSSEAHKLQMTHSAADASVQQAMDALRLAQIEEVAAAAAKAAHMDKARGLKTKIDSLDVRKAAASTKLRTLTSCSSTDGSMPVLQYARAQAEVAIDIGKLLKSTRGIISVEAKGRQSTVATAMTVVPKQLLDALVQHLLNKVTQQQEVFDRAIFCRKRLAPLEEERIQLKTIGMKDELKFNQATMMKLYNMLEEALLAAEEIDEVAKAAKKARNTHGASVDVGVVEKIDGLLAEMQSKHTQIVQIVTFYPRAEVPDRMRELEASHMHTASTRSSQDKSATRNTSTRRPQNDVAYIKKKKGDVKSENQNVSRITLVVSTVVSTPAQNEHDNRLLSSENANAPAQSPRGWSTVSAAKVEANKDKEPTPAEAARKKGNFSLFQNSVSRPAVSADGRGMGVGGG